MANCRIFNSFDPGLVILLFLDTLTTQKFSTGFLACFRNRRNLTAPAPFLEGQAAKFRQSSITFRKAPGFMS